MMITKQLGTLRQKVKQKKSFTKVKTNNNLQTYHRVWVGSTLSLSSSTKLFRKLCETDGNYILLLLSIYSDLCALVLAELMAVVWFPI